MDQHGKELNKAHNKLKAKKQDVIKLIKVIQGTQNIESQYTKAHRKCRQAQLGHRRHRSK